MNPILCPKCGHRFQPAEAARLLGQRGGSAKSEAKAAASRENGRKGGRPKADVRLIEGEE